VALAAFSYFLAHWLAQSSAARGLPGFAGSPMLMPALKEFAYGAQFVLPGIFLAGAVVSLASRAHPRAGPASKDGVHQAEPIERAGPRNEHDIYRIWAGDWDEAPPAAHGVETSAWSLGLLRALEWKRFEELCAAYFGVLGFGTRLAAPGPDGGVDIHLVPEGSDTPGVLVQCKAWSTYDIGVKAIRELFGVMAASKVAEGVFVTTGRFTQPARDFALGKEIVLIDGADLLAKIAALREDEQARLLALATAGDFTRPTCPSCGIKMVRRIARASGDPFWGCENFPGCRTTLRIAAEVV
jgi:restriction system protein